MVPGGNRCGSRWLSAATPPETRPPWAAPRQGVPETTRGEGKTSATPLRGGMSFGRCPGGVASLSHRLQSQMPPASQRTSTSAHQRVAEGEGQACAGGCGATKRDFIRGGSILLQPEVDVLRRRSTGPQYEISAHFPSQRGAPCVVHGPSCSSPFLDA